MQGNASTMRFRDNQGVAHHLALLEEGRQSDGVETIRCTATVHPSTWTSLCQNSMFSFRTLPLVLAQLDLLSTVQYVRILP